MGLATWASCYIHRMFYWARSLRSIINLHLWKQLFLLSDLLLVVYQFMWNISFVRSSKPYTPFPFPHIQNCHPHPFARDPSLSITVQPILVHCTRSTNVDVRVEIQTPHASRSTRTLPFFLLQVLLLNLCCCFWICGVVLVESMFVINGFGWWSGW